MKERIREEIELLRKKYPSLQNADNFDWVMIPDLPLPGHWNRTQTKLLFLIPPTYPHTPPDNFYVETGLRLKNGNNPSNYREGAGVPVGGAWASFPGQCRTRSLHVRG
jgi:hypothetical protein